MRTFVALVTVLFTTSALADQLPPPAKKEMTPAQTAKMLAFFDKFFAAIGGANGDCAKMAKSIDTLIDANKPAIREMKKLADEGKAMPDAANQEIEQKMTKGPGTALQACVENPAVLAALGRLEDPDRAPPPPPASAADLALVKAPVATDLEGYTKGIAGKGELLATFTTSQGTVKCQLHPDKAPVTVANFVGLATGKKPWLDPKTNKLVKNKPYYNGLIFHRVIPDFMIQGGDPMGTGMGGPGYTFADESNDLQMVTSVLAMANAGPATNGSQFFITDGDAPHLQGKHTIFGTCKQADIVKKIARVPVGSNDKPTKKVTMKVTISRGTL